MVNVKINQKVALGPVKQRFVRATLMGEILWCQGYSEPGAGSDLASLRTKGELVGDHWVVNGQKIWTSNANEAEWMFCLVRTEPDAAKHDGISYLLIEMNTPTSTTHEPAFRSDCGIGIHEVP